MLHKTMPKLGNVSMNGSWPLQTLRRGCAEVSRATTTRVARLVLPKLLDENEVKGAAMVMLFFGANDSCRGNKAITLHVPLKEFEENLHYMIWHITQVSEVKLMQNTLQLNETTTTTTTTIFFLTR